MGAVARFGSARLPSTAAGMDLGVLRKSYRGDTEVGTRGGGHGGPAGNGGPAPGGREGAQAPSGLALSWGRGDPPQAVPNLLGDPPPHRAGGDPGTGVTPLLGCR